MGLKRLFPFIFAGLMGVAAVTLLQNYVQKERRVVAAERKKLQAVFQDQVKVLVANKPIEEGTAIRVEDLAHQAMPRGFVQPSATGRPEDVVGWVTKTPIDEGQQVLRNALRHPGEVAPGTSLATVMPQGKRAVPISGEALSGVVGLVHPGDTIDVLWTVQIPKTGDQGGDVVTSTLFQNVEVLAVGSHIKGVAEARDQEKKNQTGGESAQTVTVALTPQQAALFLVAKEKGRIQLSLRSSAEKDGLTALPPANTAMLMQSALGQVAKPEPPRKTTHEVEVFKGLQRSVVSTTD